MKELLKLIMNDIALYIILSIGFLVYTWMGRRNRKNEVTFYFRANIKKKKNPLNQGEGVITSIIYSSYCWIIGLIVLHVYLSRGSFYICLRGMGKYVDEFPTVMLTTYITLITFLGIFIKWDNKKFIVCSVDKVVQKYGVYKILKIMSLEVVGHIYA